MPDRVVVACDAPDAGEQVLLWADTRLSRLSQLSQLREKT